MSEFFGRYVSFEAVAETGEARTWDGMRIAFSVEYPGRKTPKAEIRIWRLSKDSHRFIREASRVTLTAGHESASVGIVFRGDVARVAKDGAHPERITVIKAGDGERAVRDTTINLTLGPGRTNVDLQEAILSALGLPRGFVPAPSPVRDLEGGQTLSGPIKRYLDLLAEDQGAEWSISDGEINLIPNGEPRVTTAEVVSFATGLVGSPQEIVKEKNGRERVVGLKWTMLLRHQARPGDLYRLQSEEFEGLYVARKVMHKGDNWDRTFYTEIEGTER